MQVTTVTKGEGELRLFAFAGLWDRWRDPSGQWIRTCSILTTISNAVTSAVHDRMPVILDPDSYDLWLDPDDEECSRPVEMATTERASETILDLT